MWRLGSLINDLIGCRIKDLCPCWTLGAIAAWIVHFDRFNSCFCVDSRQNCCRYRVVTVSFGPSDDLVQSAKAEEKISTDL